jgi:hypothetical protein
LLTARMPVCQGKPTDALAIEGATVATSPAANNMHSPKALNGFILPP